MLLYPVQFKNGIFDSGLLNPISCGITYHLPILLTIIKCCAKNNCFVYCFFNNSKDL